MTKGALVYSLSTFNIEGSDLRAKLLETFFKLDAFPEVLDMLAQLKADGLKMATLNNESPDMLQGAISSVEIGGSLDASYTVDTVEYFKPRPNYIRSWLMGLALRKGAYDSCRRMPGSRRR